MDLPHLNVLTKIDNLRNYGDLPFDLDFYTEVQDLHYLLPHLDREQVSGIPGPTLVSRNNVEDVKEYKDEPGSKFAALNKAIIDLVEDFALVGFETLAVEDKQSMMSLLRAIDRAGGYAFGGVEGANDSVWQMAMREDGVTMAARDVQERWLDRRDEMDEEERRMWAEENKEMADVAKDEPLAQPATAPGSKHGVNAATQGDGDDDMDDLEEMRRFMETKTEGGAQVLRK